MENNSQVYHGHGIGKPVCGMLTPENRLLNSLLTPLSGGTYRGYDTGIAFSPRGDIIAGGTWGESCFVGFNRR